MKKILTILFLSITLFSVKSYAYENKTCESIKIEKGQAKYCYKNHYLISTYYNDSNKIDFFTKIYDNSGKVLIGINNYLADGFSYDGLYVYESKYGNHVFIDNSYFVEKYDFEGKPVNIDYNYYDKIIKEKDLGVYIDGKKVFDYATSKEKYVYNSFSDFINDSGIYACDDKENCIGKKYDTGVYLSEKIRERLDRFIEKIDEKKYDKEKILKKLEVLYKKFKNGKTYKSRFYTEVIIYLYSEITINKLKQQEKLEKISFYN